MTIGSWSNLTPENRHTVFEFTREKQGKNWWRILYALRMISSKLLGKKRVTKLLLMVNWYTSRMAFENIQEIIGQHEDISVIGSTRSILKDSITPGSRVLDVGCSTGHWSVLASKFGARVTGIDSNAKSISEAARVNSDIAFVNLTVEEYLLENSETFDFAIMTHIIEHLEEPEAILEILKGRVNRLLIEVPDVESSPLNFARITLGLPFYTDADHVREYSSESLEYLLSKTGWKIVKSTKRGGTIAVIAEVD